LVESGSQTADFFDQFKNDPIHQHVTLTSAALDEIKPLVGQTIAHPLERTFGHGLLSSRRQSQRLMADGRASLQTY
jgi:hypothetical protein